MCCKDVKQQTMLFNPFPFKVLQNAITLKGTGRDGRIGRTLVSHAGDCGIEPSLSQTNDLYVLYNLLYLYKGAELVLFIYLCTIAVGGIILLLSYQLSECTVSAG